ncbi:MAG: serine protease [Sneathiellales bacterium]|nr:serine protease [Sneathiellales bacterium]
MTGYKISCKKRPAFATGLFAIALAGFLLSGLSSEYAEAKTSDSVLAATAMEHYKNAEKRRKGENFFRMTLVVDQILANHPKSITALRLRKNKFKGVDLEEVREIADEWADDNPSKAKKIKAAFTSGGGAVDEDNKAPKERKPSPKPKKAEPAAPAAKEEPVVAKKPDLQPVGPERTVKYTQKDVIRMLKDSTVLILVMKTNKGKLQVSSMGSGFFINDSQIMTNAHVVRGAEQIVLASRKMGIGVGTVYRVGMTSKGLGVDAAIINATGIKPLKTLPFARSVIEGDNVAIGGFPGIIRNTDRTFARLLHFIDERVVPSKEDVPSPRFSFGAIEGIFINQKGNEDIQHGVETTGGNSGSPIVNSCGHVVGLHYSGVSLKRDNSKFNYAHSHREVEKFLKNNRVPYERAQAECDQG